MHVASERLQKNLYSGFLLGFRGDLTVAAGRFFLSADGLLCFGITRFLPYNDGWQRRRVHSRRLKLAGERMEPAQEPGAAKGSGEPRIHRELHRYSF